MAYIKYQSKGVKHPTPEQIMADMRSIARKNHVYIKGEHYVLTDYFAEVIQRVRSQSYYYANRLESLAYRHERARRFYAQNKLKAVG